MHQIKPKTNPIALIAIILCFAILSPIAQAQQLKNKYLANGHAVRKVFTPTIKKAQKSTLRVIYKSNYVAMATAVSKDGYAITKASQLPTHQIQLKDHNGDHYKASVIAIDYKHDIALLKAKTKKFVPIKWETKLEPKPGSWVITPGLHIAPISVGMVSVPKRKLRQGSQPMLGVFLPGADHEQAIIREVFRGTGARRANLRPNDVVIKAANIDIKNRAHLISILQKHKAGQWVNLTIKRGSSKINKRVSLGTWVTHPTGQSGMQNSLGGSLSIHRAGYDQVIQHDSPLRPQDCGGPVVNIDSKAYGINIARAGRTKSYIIPAKDVIKIVEELKTNKHPIHKFKP